MSTMHYAVSNMLHSKQSPCAVHVFHMAVRNAAIMWSHDRRSWRG